MDEATVETVSRVFCEVLEKQVYMFADPAGGKGILNCEGAFLDVTMGFKGEIEGRVTMVLPESLCAEIASNFLGMDADDEFVREKSRDACKELLNVTCGHILTALRGEAPVFDLSIPVVTEVTPETVASWVGVEGTLPFAVEGEPVLLKVELG